MTQRSFHFSALAAGVAALALMAPVSSAQAQAPNAQIHQHAATHGMTGPAKRTVQGAAMQRGEHGAENRTVNSRRTVTNRRVVTTSRFGATYGGVTYGGGTTVAGGVVSGGGGYYAGGYGHHGCWWYRHYAPGNIPSWCGASYGYAAPASGYSYGYASGPSRFGTATRVNRQFTATRQTTVTHRTDMTASRKENMTGARAHGGTEVAAHGGAKVAGMAGHRPSQKVTH
jgi:hypothetical protein